MTSFLAALTNYSGDDLNNLALSKSTTRRFRVTVNILRNFIRDVGQVYFDDKLLPDLYGFAKVNRLAVVLVQKDHNQLLCILNTSDATGRTEALEVKAALDKLLLLASILHLPTLEFTVELVNSCNRYWKGSGL